MVKPTRESFKIGRRKIGTLYRWDGGQTCLVVARSRKEIYRGRNVRISHAVEEGIAMWSVDTVTLSRARSRGVNCIAVKVREDGEIYITSLARFIRDGKNVDPRRRNGSAQRSLKVQSFLRKPGRVKL